MDITELEEDAERDGEPVDNIIDLFDRLADKADQLRKEQKENDSNI